jgi:hypothetical protein
MLSFYLIFGAGLLGVVGHWLTRWAQGRTQNTFWEYLSAYKANTLSSLFANIFSSGVIYSSTPADISGRALVLVVIGAYCAGYTLDSKVNKDESLDDGLMKERLEGLPKEPVPIQTKQDSAHAEESLADVLHRDANL